MRYQLKNTYICSRSTSILLVSCVALLLFVPQHSASSEEVEWITTREQPKNRWEIWGSDLVDWNHYHLFVQGIRRWRTLGIASQKGEAAQYTAMLVSIVKTGKYSKDKIHLVVSEKARASFRALLDHTFPPIRYYDIQEDNFIGSSSWKPSIFEKSHQRIQDWERFTQTYKGEKYLCGYARLYAYILKSLWVQPVEETLKGFAAIENDYSYYPQIAIMAAWYRCTLLVYIEHPEATHELRKMYERYSSHKLWVVRSAGILHNYRLSQPSHDGGMSYFGKQVDELIHDFYQLRAEAIRYRSNLNVSPNIKTLRK